MKLTVSVIIPVYNEQRDIAKCLDSLMGQTDKPNEIIIVNNNSTDKTIDIVSKYKGVRIINETRKGITYARTTGFNAAKSDIIARVDADTIASPNWVKAIKDKFNSDSTICGLAGRVAVRELSPRGLFWFSFLPDATRWIGNLLVGSKNLMSGHNMAIKRSVWEQVADYVHLGDETVNEDVDISLFVLKIGKVAQCRKMLVKTRMFEMFFNFSKINRYYKTNKNTVALHKKMNIPKKG